MLDFDATEKSGDAHEVFARLNKQAAPIAAPRSALVGIRSLDAPRRVEGSSSANNGRGFNMSTGRIESEIPLENPATGERERQREGLRLGTSSRRLIQYRRTFGGGGKARVASGKRVWVPGFYREGDWVRGYYRSAG